MWKTLNIQDQTRFSIRNHSIEKKCRKRSEKNMCRHIKKLRIGRLPPPLPTLFSSSSIDLIPNYKRLTYELWSEVMDNCTEAYEVHNQQNTSSLGRAQKIVEKKSWNFVFIILYIMCLIT